MSSESTAEMPLGADFDHRDRESAYCPWSRWAKFRKEAPVFKTEKYGGVFVVSRYEDVFAAIRDTDTFGNEQPNIPPKPMPKLPPVMIDPPEHQGYREIVNPFFTPDKVAAYRPWLHETVGVHLKRVLAQDSFDVATDLSFRVTNDVTLHFLGITDAPADFKAWVEELALQRSDAAAAAQKVMQFLSEEVQRRREKLGDDVISALISAKYEGARDLTHEEIVNMALLLTLAGFDTTASVMNGAIWYLVSHEDAQRTLAAADDKGWRLALDEFVRWTSPVTANARTVRTDTALHGCPMHKGDQVLLMYASANRDEAEFEKADEMVLDRFPNRHIGFGLGTHRCLGSHLAKAIMEEVLRGLVPSLGKYRLADPDQVEWATAASIRSIRRLPIVKK